MESFGERFKRLRLEKGLTQEELGKKVMLNKSTISRYEKEVHMPETPDLAKFADLFEVSIDYLLCRTDDKKAYVIRGEDVPEELRKLGVEELGVEEEVKKHGLSKEDIEEVIEYIRFKGQKKEKD